MPADAEKTATGERDAADLTVKSAFWGLAGQANRGGRGAMGGRGMLMLHMCNKNDLIGIAVCCFMSCAAGLWPAWHPDEPPVIPPQVDLRAPTFAVSGSVTAGNGTAWSESIGVSGAARWLAADGSMGGW